MPTETARGASEKQSADLLVHLGTLLATAANPDAFFEAALPLIVQALGVKGCSIFLLDHADSCLKLKASTRIPRESWGEIRIQPGEGIAGKVAESGEALWARNEAEVEALTQAPPKAQYETHSFISMPIKLQDETIGVANVDSRLDGAAFNEEATALLKGLSDLFASALANSRLLEERTQANRNFDAILQSVYMGVIAFDSSFQIKHCNRTAARLLGLDEELCGSGEASTTLPPKVYQRFVRMVGEMRTNGGISVCGEIDLSSSARTSPIPLGLSVAQLRSNGAPPTGYVMVIEDLRVRREVTELRHLAELQSHFLSLISHELRSPLTAIKGAVHVLASTKEGLAPCNVRMLEIVQRNCRRLGSVIEDMLEVQSIESARVQLDLKPADLEQIVRASIDSVSLLWEEKMVEVTVSVNGASPADLRLDRDRMGQVLKHLLDNAFKFCNPGGKITVRIESKDGGMEVRISNTGQPISAQYRDQIFGKFYQVETPMTRRQQGSGLGLYLARELTRLHKGNVTLEKSDAGETTFLLWLPLAAVGNGKAEALA